MIRILLFLAFAICWRLGGWNRGRPGKWAQEGWGGWRKLVIPAAVAIAYSWVYWNLLLGALLFLACQIIRMGDGSWDPENDDKPSILASLTHDRSGVWIKAIDGLIVGVFTPLPRYFIGGLDPWHHVIFAVGFSVLSGLLKKVDNAVIEESCRGAWFAGILLI